MIDRVREVWFSSHHLIRDLIGALAPLTAFIGFVVASYAPAQIFAKEFFEAYLLSISFWAFVLALTIYLIGGYFIGSLVAFTGNFVHRMVQRVPLLGPKYSYTFWYNQNAADIDEVYKRYFANQQWLSSGAAVSPTDKVNALKLYLQKYNPQGYAEAYRQFMKIDIVRAALLYPLALLGHETYLLVLKYDLSVQHVNMHVVVISALVLAASLVELPRRIRKVVRTEYLFILATSRIVEDLQKLDGLRPLSNHQGLSGRP